MRRMLLLPLCLWCAVIIGCMTSGSGKRTLTTEKEKNSYALGVTVGKELRRRGIRVEGDGVDPKLFAQAVRDTLTGAEPLMSSAEVIATTYAFTTELQHKRAEDMEKASALRRKLFEEFLTENSRRDGVVTLPSGLQYEVLRPGDGRIPRPNDAVRCVYRTTTIDGVELDSSQLSGRPTVFRVSELMAGFQEALTLMPEGSKWKLLVPPALAEGGLVRLKGAGSGQPLVFEVELVAITQRDDEAAVVPAFADELPPLPGPW